MMRWFDRTLGMALWMGISTVFAQSDPMSVYYDNTLVCRSAAAMQCHIWFKSDGTYRQYVLNVTPEGTFRLTGIEGKFTVSAKNGVNETCLIPQRIAGPMSVRPTECYALASRKVGDVWSVTTNGTAMELSLQAGREVNAASGFL